MTRLDLMSLFHVIKGWGAPKKTLVRAIAPLVYVKALIYMHIVVFGMQKCF